MATETHASRGKVRGNPRMTRSRLGLLAAIVALCALAVIAVEVAAPLSAGLPIGWGQYDKAEFHLHVGTPPFWNVVGDNDLIQGAANTCAFAVVTSPPTEPALHSTRDTMKAPRWIAVYATAPCSASAPDLTHAWVWQPTGQRVSVAGQSAPVEINSTPDIPQVSYRVRVTLHGYTYTFALQDPTAAQARSDLPDFLTLVHSFRYTS